MVAILKFRTTLSRIIAYLVALDRIPKLRTRRPAPAMFLRGKHSRTFKIRHRMVLQHHHRSLGLAQLLKVGGICPYTHPGMLTALPGRTMSDESWWSRRSSKFRNMSAQKLGSAQRLGAPWVLDTNENKQSNTAQYDRHHTRKRLFINCTFQLFVTGAFCAGLVGTLKGFQDRGPLDDRSKRVFNAIVTGLSIAIGINLASSLQSYARMLRWRLLATGWKSLEEFDLILGAESQTKVLRLLWAGRRRKAGFPYLSKTQICCIIWLLVNLAAQVLVAMNGLTFC